MSKMNQPLQNVSTEEMLKEGLRLMFFNEWINNVVGNASNSEPMRCDSKSTSAQVITLWLKSGMTCKSQSMFQTVRGIL